MVRILYLFLPIAMVTDDAWAEKLSWEMQQDDADEWGYFGHGM